MPVAQLNGVELYYEQTGQGFPLVWSHEFGGDYRSWEPQVRYFARRYRVITYNHRGYPPSSVPKEADAYDNNALVEDLHQLLRHLGIARAHVGGLSMGGNVALNFGIRHPEMAASLIVAGCGSGTVEREEFLAEYGRLADDVERGGMAPLVERFGALATRQVFRAKDPRGWGEFLRYLDEHCADIGRDPSDIERTVSFPIVIRDREADATAAWRGMMAANGIEDAGNVPHLLGSPQAAADAIRPYLNIGFTTVICRMPAPFDRETINRVGELRELLGRPLLGG